MLRSEVLSVKSYGLASARLLPRLADRGEEKIGTSCVI